MISVIVVNHNRRELLDACLSSITRALAEVAEGGEMFVVDNDSTDGSAEMVHTHHPQAQLHLLDRNLGFAGAIADAIRLTSGHWVALVNNDAVLDPGCLRALLDAVADQPLVGSANPQVRFASAPAVINTTGLAIDKLGIAYDRDIGRPVSAQPARPVEIFGVSGCVALYRREMLRDVGGFDADFFAYAEDADLAWRARMAGWRALYVPAALACHHGSATAGEASDFKYRLVGRNRVRLIAKNASLRQLLCWGWLMVAYDVAYVVFVLLAERSSAPLAGRIEGLRGWPAARRAGRSTRRPVRLCGVYGWREALRMRAAYGRYGAQPSNQARLTYRLSG